MHHILDCYAVWPKINQPYIWSDSENRTVPSPDVNDKAAHYELMINLKEKQLKELIEAIRKAWKDAIASGYVTKENADKCSDPKNFMKITKLDIQPKKIRVVQLAARQTPAMVDDFEAEAAPIDPDADDFDAPQETVTFGDQQTTVGGNASQDFDDEIPF